MHNIEFKLCVSCMTFNQSRYIEDALNGFCMQQTSFPFVCIIIDDASTDGEPEVINHYLDEHFDMSGLSLLPDSYVSEGEVSDYVAMGQRNFQLTEHAAPWRCDAKEGVYTFAQHKTNKNCFVLSLNLKKNLYGVKDSKVKLIAPWEQTKYIALCEGDDYWTDPYKLQKQVDFLESHKDYSMCVSNRRVLLQDGSFYEDIQPWTTKTMEDVLKGYIPHTQTIVYLYSDKKLFESSCREVVSPFGDGDRAVAWYAAKIGNIYNFPEQMAVYRLGVGVMSAVQENQLEYFRIESYVGFQHRINIPDRKLYVSCLTDKCWDLYYYSHKRKQTELFESADKALKLWRKELTFVEQVGCFSKYFSTKIKRHKGEK